MPDTIGTKATSLGTLGHRIIENFLPKYSFNRLKSLVESVDFPYYYHDFTVRPLIEKRRHNDFMFVHSLVRNKEACSNFVDAVLFPIIDQLEVSFEQVIRSKINLTPRSPEHHLTDFHVDQDIVHTVALFYVTTCNGYTELKNGTKIDCRANRMLLFDGSFKHRAVSHTNHENKIRVSINTNLEIKPFYQS